MKLNFKRIILDYLAITFGCLLTSLGFIIFLIPNKIAPGGASGLATIFFHLFGFPVGIVMFVINIPLFFIGIKVLGKRIGFRTFYGIALLSAFTDLLAPYVPILTHDLLLASLYGGGFIGFGLGIVFKSRGTTGGTDLLAALINNFFPAVSIGQGVLLVDVLVVAIAGIVFNAELALYAVISLFVSSKIIDLVQLGFNLAKAALIISDKSAEIREHILEKMGRGVTTLDGKGGYTGKDKDVLLVIVSRAEVTQLKRLVSKIDADSFVILTEVHEVMGEGFKEIQV